MSMDLTGIVNRNEYYTNHYFSAIFAENAKNTISEWRAIATESDLKTPWAKLRDVGSKYSVLRDNYLRHSSANDKEEIVLELATQLLTALDYDAFKEPTMIEIDDEFEFPVHLEVQRSNGTPLLWAILANGAESEVDLLNNSISSLLHEDRSKEIHEMTNEELISKVFFSLDEPPRWVLLIGMNQVVLLDRSKWNEKRYLLFELEDVFGRREETTLQAMSVLLHKDHLCPDEGTSLLDELDENSHKHASSVSEDLKYALRESIELLGNEVIYDKRTRLKEGVYNKELADDLTVECLRYMYRILFILFIEARPELGYAPMGSQTYLQGYSLESLRDVVGSVRDGDTEAEDGYFLHESLNKLFEIIYNGYDRSKDSIFNNEDEESHHNVFVIEPLKAHIFDPDKTKHISRAKLRNSVLIKIIDLMSVSREGRGTRGRISYSALGINQMGAVYEALLSYRGFFAEERLYEVKRARDTFNELDVGYFVPEKELDQYTEEERVRNDDNSLRVYEKGTFIYRLAGREREKSASYYTPEVLTECLVKYALKELLEGKTADEILELKICEPAMGSAAFLNEAVNQLAEAYLTLKQMEIDTQISHEDWLQELQKVKMYIADRNVYGIDLNPIAVELGEVSLWLNTIYKGAHVPWFGTQLVCGNSLIGARRQVYKITRVTTKTKAQQWFNHAPDRVPTDSQRNKDTEVYHFLLGDPGMSSYKDRVIRDLEPEAIKHINNWNKEFAKPLEKEEKDTLLRLSAIIDDLWERQITLREQVTKETRDPLTVFGQEKNGGYKQTSIREKDKIYQHLYKSEEMENAGPYARLKAAMDYWCALWFWPIEHAEELPSRKEFLFDMSLILEGGVISVRPEPQLKLFEDEGYTEIRETYGDLNQVNLDMLRKNNSRLRLSEEIAKRHRFFHWELEFADVFAERGGFDLILGNPPWILLEFNERDVLSDYQPLLTIKNFKSNQTAKVRPDILKDEMARHIYLDEYQGMIGTQNFLRTVQNFPMLVGMKVNLYKCFLPQAWTYGNIQSVSGFLHPDGVYDDPQGGNLRGTLYPKLRFHFQFINELKLFPEVDHHMVFSLNIYSNEKVDTFDSIANLFSPITIDQCYERYGGELPGIKDKNNKWNIEGDNSRIVEIGKTELKLFAQLLDDSFEPMEARLPVLHAGEFIDVLRHFISQDCTIGSLDRCIFGSQMWNETNAMRDGFITRQVHFPEGMMDTIYSGPHIGVANPLFKTSRRICRINSDYDNVDLTMIAKDYIQRINYMPGGRLEDYIKRVPSTPWQNKYFSQPRILMRNMFNLTGERTLVSAIAMPNTGHVHAVYGLAVKDVSLLVLIAGDMASIVYDFYIKILGKGSGGMNVIGGLPVVNNHIAPYKIVRALLLNCLTTHYSSLWMDCFKEEFVRDGWAKEDPRLSPERFTSLSKEWTWDTPLRTDYERRQALVELDVLTAMGLGLTLEQLKTIYRIQFPVLRQYEQDTWYDRNGRIVFTNNRSLTGVGYKRPEFNEIKDAKSGVFTRTITDDTQPGGPVERTIEYVAPFDRCDREEDYETVWAYFEEKFKNA